jgi:formylglycine-generating enzyme required for sulfatase activity
MKAGILPRLAPHVSFVYLEATPDQTESRLLRALQRRCPDLPGQLGLVDTMTRLRQGHGLRAGQKIVVVIDQFEQWLHTHRQIDDAELIQALRQCDGLHVLCVLMVRDDFWLDVSRFMHAVEVPLIEGHNSGLIDLFDLLHARKVLQKLGRAYGRVPEQPMASRELDRFFDQAIAGVTEGGKVSPVRLSLFVEMFKGKPWTPRVLNDLGGAEAIGVLFLQESFDSDTAPAKNRLHAQAARRVLQGLLPASKTPLRAHALTRAELLQASGYAGNPQAFADLLAILDQELRLVTPVAAERTDETGGGVQTSGAPGADSEHQSPSSRPLHGEAMRYQLTHDFLVASLRRWLTRAQRETWRGRAELCLAERTEEWSLQKGTRLLPSWSEWIGIRLWVSRSQWSTSQQNMMRTANRHHFLRTGGWCSFLLLLGLIGAWVRRDIVEERHQSQAIRIIESVSDFHDDRLSHLRAEVQEVPQALPMLKAWIADPNTRATDRTHTRMVLLPFDSEQIQPLVETMLMETPEEVLEIRGALEPYGRDVTPELWRRLEDGTAAPGTRLRAAAGLATFDPNNKNWGAAAEPVIAYLLEHNTSELSTWLRAFAPVRQALMPPLMHAFADTSHPEKQRLATGALVQYAADQPDILVDLMLQANPAQYQLLWPVFERHRATVITRLKREYQSIPPGHPEAVNQRRAQALVTLLRLGQPASVWPLLQHSSNPELRSFLIHLFGPLDVDPRVLCDRYEQEQDVSARRALLLSIGTFEVERLPTDLRKAWTPRLLATFRDDPDPGLHAAAEWLLRRWGNDKESARLLPALARRAPLDPRHWFVNSQGQTLVILPAPGEKMVGSPPQEVGRRADEARRRVFLDKSFAIATTSVTYEQFRKFLKAHPNVRHNRLQEYGPAVSGPALNVSWYQSAQYCRWLSEQEGVPEEQMCYPSVAEIKEGMKPPADFLKRTGYRLPTEAEWEYACRAGADTSRYYGSSETLLQHYAWYLANAEDHAWPVGMRKPNDFGLFDMHGNASTWCQDHFVAQPTAETGSRAR